MALAYFFRILSRFLAIGLALGLLLACYLYFFPIPAAPALDTLNNFVPWLMLGGLFFGVYGMIARQKELLWSWVPLGLSLVSMGLPLRIGPEALPNSGAGIRIMSYNTRNFNYRGFRNLVATGDSITHFLKEQAPDILCVQEFSIIGARKLSNYPFYYLPLDSRKATMGIFSKYPIVGSGEVSFPNSQNNALYADITLGKDTIRIYNVHLQSFRIGSRSFLYRDYGIRLLKRLGQVARMHSQQVEAVKAHQANSPYPSIICGDFNATAFSRTYREMKRGMQDSFKEKGRGLGSTFFLKRVPFRIDFVLADPTLECIGHQVHPIRMSDHLPVEVTLRPVGQ